MSKKSAYLGLLGAAAMMSIDPRTHEAMAETKRHMKTKPQLKKPEPPTAKEMLKVLDTINKQLNEKVAIWNTNSSHKLKEFVIYGYVVKGTTIKNATKRLRKMQADCNLLPGTTVKDLKGEKTRLNKIVKAIKK